MPKQTLQPTGHGKFGALAKTAFAFIKLVRNLIFGQKYEVCIRHIRIKEWRVHLLHRLGHFGGLGAQIFCLVGEGLVQTHKQVSKSRHCAGGVFRKVCAAKKGR